MITTKFKKGALPDIMILMITIFVFAVGLFILAFIIPQIADGMNDAGMNNTDEGRNSIEELERFGLEGMQEGFFMLFCGLVLGVLITSYFANVHSIWLFLYIIFLGLTIFVGTYLANAYEQLILNPAFSEMFASQTLITNVMENIVGILIATAVLSFIIIFMRKTSQGGITKGEL